MGQVTLAFLHEECPLQLTVQLQLSEQVKVVDSQASTPAQLIAVLSEYSKSANQQAFPLAQLTVQLLLLVQLTVADVQDVLPVQETRQSLPSGHVILAFAQVSVFAQSRIQLLLLLAQAKVASVHKKLPVQDKKQSLSSEHVISALLHV